MIVNKKIISTIVKEYIESDISIKNIAKKYGISQKVATEILHKYNDAKKSYKAKKRIDSIEQYLYEKKSVEEIANEYSVSMETVKKWIRLTNEIKERDDNKLEQSLLIGNGLNNCLVSHVDWGKLLEEIASGYGVDYQSEISMPLEFERIINKALESGKYLQEKNIITDAKEKVASIVLKGKLTSPVIHEEIKRIKINNILTTNYDLLLEEVFDKNYARSIDNSQTKYIDETTDIIGNYRFYHIHGVATTKNSICLGYEHYMGQVMRLRKEYNAKENGCYSILDILRGVKPGNQKWGQLFYSTNMAIIGLGLSESEADLWWILTHRASLYYRNVDGARYLINNVIVYYDVMDDISKSDEKETYRLRKNGEKEKLYQLMNGLHISVKIVYLSKTNGDYAEAYKLMIDDIEKNGISGSDNITEL